jgi:starch synthase
VVRDLKILFVASEATPLAKVGGLGDVAGELPRALRKLGLDVRLALPLYPQIRSLGLPLEKVCDLAVPRAGGSVPAQVYSVEVRDVPVLLVDGEPVRSSDEVYRSSQIDAEKFTFFCMAALLAAESTSWRPDVLHANDWMTAPALLALDQRRETVAFWEDIRLLFTIHNLAFLGTGANEILEAYGIPSAQSTLLPEWAQDLPLPRALERADGLTTVSPTYAREIQTPAYGHGLEGVLQARREALTGILNGLDPENWDPSVDPVLDANFTLEDLPARGGNKSGLQQELGLPVDRRSPLCAMVTRLVHQKGVDLALEALEKLDDLPWQFVLLGSGEAELEQAAVRFEHARPERARALNRFDERLARRIYAGSDLLLVPSRYEPCGLAQMIAMGYGSIPVARATGGLRDTVQAYEPPGTGTGFLFEQPEASALAGALRLALDVYADEAAWRGLQRRAMQQTFPWDRTAEKYQSLYASLVAADRAGA